MFAKRSGVKSTCLFQRKKSLAASRRRELVLNESIRDGECSLEMRPSLSGAISAHFRMPAPAADLANRANPSQLPLMCWLNGALKPSLIFNF